MSEHLKNDHKANCKCDSHEIRDAAPGGCCSKETVMNCHGPEMVKKLENEGKFK